MADDTSSWERLISRGLDAWVDSQAFRSYRPNEPAYYSGGDGSGFPAGNAAPQVVGYGSAWIIGGVAALALLFLLMRK